MSHTLMLAPHHFIQLLLWHNLERNTIFLGQVSDFLFHFTSFALLEKYFFYRLSCTDGLCNRVMTVDKVGICHLNLNCW